MFFYCRMHSADSSDLNIINYLSVGNYTKINNKQKNKLLKITRTRY